MNETIIAILGSNALTSYMTFLFTKKKYLTEVSSSELDNVEKAIAIYKGMVEDLGMRIDIMSKNFEELRKENEHLVLENRVMKRKLSQMAKQIKETQDVNGSDSTA